MTPAMRRARGGSLLASKGKGGGRGSSSSRTQLVPLEERAPTYFEIGIIMRMAKHMKPTTPPGDGADPGVIATR